ncbi:MAG TPA: hypothetical protein VGN34_20130 [Ktedonobacteraceae bacterium]|jgi:hypothetical protein
MSYRSFRERMRVVARQAALSCANMAPEYQRLVEILDANDDSRQAERALWDEYDATKKVFFQRKAWDLQRER